MGALAYLSNTAQRLYEDYLVTGPRIFFRPAFEVAMADADRKVAALQDGGVADMGQYCGADDVQALRHAMDVACRGEHLDSKVKFSEASNYHVIIDPLNLHARVLQLATDPAVCSLAERYFRNKVCLADIDARVIPPTRLADVEQELTARGLKTNYSSSHWHRDARGRQLKLMIYLSDVGEEDSCFAYLPDTHKGVSLRPKYEETRFTEDGVVGMRLRPQEWLGKAGSAKLFDTNIIHRLRRRATGTVRYSITFYYTPGQQLKPMIVKRSYLALLPEAARAVVLAGPEGRVTIVG